MNFGKILGSVSPAFGMASGKGLFGGGMQGLAPMLGGLGGDSGGLLSLLGGGGLGSMGGLLPMLLGMQGGQEGGEEELGMAKAPLQGPGSDTGMARPGIMGGDQGLGLGDSFHNGFVDKRTFDPHNPITRNQDGSFDIPGYEMFGDLIPLNTQAKSINGIPTEVFRQQRARHYGNGRYPNFLTQYP